MPRDYIDNAIQHVQEIKGEEPTLQDLIESMELWRRIERYWRTLSDETDRRIAGSDTIRILDFDIIYPAFWRTDIRKDDSLESRLGFPMTLRYVLLHTQRPFTIPPGAYFELAHFLNKATLKYKSAKSRLGEMVNTVERVPASMDPYRMAQELPLKAQENAMEVLKKMPPEAGRVVDELIDVVTTLREVQKLLNHEKYVPWVNVAEQVGAQVETEDVLKLWSLFNAQRGHRLRNNYVDALNVATYYTLLRALYSDKSSIRYPLLASSTRMVLRTSVLPPDSIANLGRGLLEDAIQPVSSQYLAFATAAELYAEDDLKVLDTLTHNGLVDSHKLLDHWSIFWAEWNQKAKGRNPKRVRLTELTRMSSFRGLCTAYVTWKTRFFNIIGNTFMELARADRQLRENYNISRQFALSKNPKKALAAGASTALGLDSGEESVVNWDTSTSLIDSRMITEYALDSPGQNMTLTALRATKMIREIHNFPAEPAPMLRTIVRLSENEKEKLLVWERAVESELQLCYWDNRLGFVHTLSCIKRFLDQVGDESGSGVQIDILAEDLHERINLKFESDVSEWLDAILNETLDPEYLRIETDACTVFLDVVPGDEAVALDEPALLEIGVMYEEERLHRLVAELHHNTSNVLLEVSAMRVLLDEYASDFKKREDSIRKLAEVRKAAARR